VVAAPEHHGVRGVGDGQPGAEGAAAGGREDRDGLVGLRALAGEEPDQIVHPVPGMAGHLALGDVEKLRVEQPLQYLLGIRYVRVEQRAGDPHRDLRQVDVPEPQQQPLVVGRQAGVAERDAGPDIEVAVGELVQPSPLVAQYVGELRHGPVRFGGELRRRDADRQR
jgi:hypothetical protein